MIAFVADVRDTVLRLQAHRQRCNDIERADPPTAMQQRLINICESALQASVAFEMARLSANLSSMDSGVRDLFAGCFRSEEEITFDQIRKILKNVLKFILK